MNILAIETSSSRRSIALLAGNTLHEETIAPADKRNLGRLVVVMDLLLRQQDLDAGNIDAITVSAGPGSYTGIRIGYSLAKGLAFTKNIPILSFSSTEVIAHGVKEKGILAVAISSRKNEIYTALFDSPQPGSLKRLTSDTTTDPDSFIASLKQGTIIVGNGLEPYKKDSQLKDFYFYDAPQCNFPKASTLALLAQKEILKKDIVTDDYSVIPHYIGNTYLKKQNGYEKF